MKNRLSQATSKPHNEAKKILKILEDPRAGRRQVLADRISTDGVAEAVTEIQPGGESEVDADVGPKHGTGGSELGGWQGRITAGRD